jgi:FtsZ-interacting cell division protein ZipA
MSDAAIVILIVAAVVVVALIVFAIWRGSRRRHESERLQDRFGPEYDRMVDDEAGRRERRSAESELAEREEQREELEIRPLGPGQRERYAARWQETQARFVDAPGPALDEAEMLLQQVMQERGYPVDEGFEQQSALISVDHPQLVENYRQAHATRDRIRTGGTDTETMRTAMLRYRSLFDELLAPDGQHVS